MFKTKFVIIIIIALLVSGIFEICLNIEGIVIYEPSKRFHIENGSHSVYVFESFPFTFMFSKLIIESLPAYYFVNTDLNLTEMWNKQYYWKGVYFSSFDVYNVDNIKQYSSKYRFEYDGNITKIIQEMAIDKGFNETFRRNNFGDISNYQTNNYRYEITVIADKDIPLDLILDNNTVLSSATGGNLHYSIITNSIFSSLKVGNPSSANSTIEVTIRGVHSIDFFKNTKTEVDDSYDIFRDVYNIDEFKLGNIIFGIFLICCALSILTLFYYENSEKYYDNFHKCYKRRWKLKV